MSANVTLSSSSSCSLERGGGGAAPLSGTQNAQAGKQELLLNEVALGALKGSAASASSELVVRSVTEHKMRLSVIGSKGAAPVDIDDLKNCGSR